MAGSGASSVQSGPYLQFRNEAGDVAFLAHPVTFLPGMSAPHAIQPGSRDALGRAGIWANDMNARSTTDWVDDEIAGLFCRKIYDLADALRVVGRIHGVPHRIDDVLQVGKNVVVYQLTNLSTGASVAYGFGREFFDARHALIKYLTRVGEQKQPMDGDLIIKLADRVLEAFPNDVTALFNKGVVLLATKKFLEAHQLFSSVVSRDANDQLAILHNGAALGGLGQHEQAVRELGRADALSEKGVHSLLFGAVRDLLRMSVNNVMSKNGDSQLIALWLKYFPPEEQTEPVESPLR